MAILTRTSVAAIRADVEAALKTIYAKHGVDVSVGRITFTPDSFRCKIEGIVRGAAGTNATAPVDPKALGLAKKGYLLGPKFNATCVYVSPSLGRVRFVGFNAKAHKYPFVVQTTNGKRYKLPTYSAKSIVEAGAVA